MLLMQPRICSLGYHAIKRGEFRLVLSEINPAIMDDANEDETYFYGAAALCFATSLAKQVRSGEPVRVQLDVPGSCQRNVHYPESTGMSSTSTLTVHTDTLVDWLIWNLLSPTFDTIATLNGDQVRGFLAHSLSFFLADSGVVSVSVQYAKKEGRHFINTSILKGETARGWHIENSETQWTIEVSSVNGATLHIRVIMRPRCY